MSRVGVGIRVTAEVSAAPWRPNVTPPPFRRAFRTFRMFPELSKLDLQQCSGRRPPSAERSAALSRNANVLGTPPSRQEPFSLHAGFGGNPPSSRFLESPSPLLVPGSGAATLAPEAQWRRRQKGVSSAGWRMGRLTFGSW